MTKPNSTEIVFVLDRSGSMQSIAEDMRGGFDSFITEQKKLPGECRVTLTQFDNEYEIVYAGKPLAEVPKLALIPRGDTALYDAIGRTIVATGERLAAMNENDRPSKVIFVVITDGFENASTEYHAGLIHAMITEQRYKYSWEFAFLGADQNAIGVAKDLGVHPGNAVSYRGNSQGTKGLLRGLSAQIGHSRATGATFNYSQAVYDSYVTDTPDPSAAPPSQPK